MAHLLHRMPMSIKFLLTLLLPLLALAWFSVSGVLERQRLAASRSLDEQASDMAQLIGQFKVSDSRQPDCDYLPTGRAAQPKAFWCS